MNSGADYQTQLGVKCRFRRSVNIPMMEATIRLHTARLGYADCQRKCCKNSHPDKCWGDVVDYPAPHKSDKTDIYVGVSRSQNSF